MRTLLILVLLTSSVSAAAQGPRDFRGTVLIHTQSSQVRVAVDTAEDGSPPDEVVDEIYTLSTNGLFCVDTLRIENARVTVWNDRLVISAIDRSHVVILRVKGAPQVELATRPLHRVRTYDEGVGLDRRTGSFGSFADAQQCFEGQVAEGPNCPPVALASR